MTPEEQRIAIAEACPDIFWISKSSKQVHFCDTDDVTDPLEDLNAMHEAEKVLNDDKKHIYAEMVYNISHGFKAEASPYIPAYFEVSHGSVFTMIHATASQRAEAFLKTLNLWKD